LLRNASEEQREIWLGDVLPSCLRLFSRGQSGVSNQRDAYGNLIRNSGGYSVKGIDQGPVNNGPIKNSSAQPPTTDAGTAKGTGR
jgi:hypothetical protein